MGFLGEYGARPDRIDLELAAKRQASRELLELYNQGFNPLCGDVVVFPRGERLRISYVWDRGEQPSEIQTSHQGNWYWADKGHMDFSGALLVPIPADTFAHEGEHAEVAAWFFHHDLTLAQKHDLKCTRNSVDVIARVRVWRTTADLPTS